MQKGSVVAVKTIAGEEIIGRLAEDYTGNSVSLKRALVVMFTPNQTIGLVPYMMSLDEGDTFEIAATAISVKPCKPSKKFEDGYLQQTSGIQLVKP